VCAGRFSAALGKKQSRTKVFAFAMMVGLSSWRGQEMRPCRVVKER